MTTPHPLPGWDASESKGNSYTLSSTVCHLYPIHLAPVVQKVDISIHWINRYPAYKCTPTNTFYPLDSDLYAE